MNSVKFSIILPIYNQESHLKEIVESYKKTLDKIKGGWEVILVVNGSKDNSFQKAKSLCEKYKNFSFYNLKLGGWGRAVKFGLSKGKGKYLCYTNSARTNVEDLILILKYAEVNEDVVVKASRIVRERFDRKFGSVLYNFENRLIYKTPIWDVNGTPKVIPTKVYKKLKITSDDDLIDAEIMAKCVKNSVKIIEIPITNFQRISGKSTTSLASALKMYFGLLKLKWKVNNE